MHDCQTSNALHSRSASQVAFGETKEFRRFGSARSARMLATIGIMATLLGASFAVVAQQMNLPGISVKLGDDVSAVKTALHTSTDPESIPRNPMLPANLPDPNKGKSVLHLRTKGLWAFFNSAGSLETIRLDAPFNGDVLGVRLGDSAQTLTSRLGKPLTKPMTAFAFTQAYRYALDDSAYVTFDLNDDGVQYIFISR